MPSTKRPSALSVFPSRFLAEETRGIIGWHFVAQSDILLAVLGNELFRFDLAKREWLDAGRPFRLPPAVKPVNGALAINGRTLLIATLGDGLFEIDARDRRVRQWQYSANDPSSLGNNIIYHLFQDRSGVVWISTEGGVSLIRGGKLKFPLYRHRYGDGGTISGNYVTAIHKDAAGFLWIGTGGTGLNRVDEAGSRVRVYRRDARSPMSASATITSPRSRRTPIPIACGSARRAG